MTIRLPLLALGAVLTLSACNDSGHTIVQQGPADPMANEIAMIPKIVGIIKARRRRI